MDIQIDHRGPRGEPIAAQCQDRHRQIVEHAESRAFTAECVVRAASQIAAEAARHRVARCGQRTAHRCQGAAHQLWRPRKTDAAHHAVAGRAIQNCPHVCAIVGQFNRRGIGRRRRLKIVHTVRCEQRAQAGVLFDWELMTWRQRDGVMVAVEEARAHSFTHGAADGVGNIAAQGLDQFHVASLHHDARQRLGA